ncbi:unnamed protein product [Heligmosomoides polygyrus]|uniref:GP-PDE domain-containing protein n=1 Tax=Heligmosomoides polygyrus TaxID=6339 RepID=A0A183F5R1_HELPZ|nr:unnamed protein product [Heligmosomoides polygyrus]
MFDVRLTNDDVAVVTKDDNKNRVEVKTLNVSETSSAQLHRIHLRKGKGEIPLFNEMMEACQKKDARVVVNIQRSSNTLFKLIADYVRKHDLQNRVIVTSFNPYVPFMMKKKDSQILTGLSFSSTGITTHFARTQRDSIVFKYIGQFLDAIMHVVVDSFVLPTFVGSDVIFLDHKDVNL